LRFVFWDFEIGGYHHKKGGLVCFATKNHAFTVKRDVKVRDFLRREVIRPEILLRKSPQQQKTPARINSGGGKKNKKNSVTVFQLIRICSEKNLSPCFIRRIMPVLENSARSNC
jgi:hypothetical protein